MKKNNLNDLNEYLFASLDAITNDDLDDKQLEKEIKRAKAVSIVASKIIDNANTAISAAKLASEYRKTPKAITELIGENAQVDR